MGEGENVGIHSYFLCNLICVIYLLLRWLVRICPQMVSLLIKWRRYDLYTDNESIGSEEVVMYREVCGLWNQHSWVQILDAHTFCVNSVIYLSSLPFFFFMKHIEQTLFHEVKLG